MHAIPDMHEDIFFSFVRSVYCTSQTLYCRPCELMYETIKASFFQLNHFKEKKKKKWLFGLLNQCMSTQNNCSDEVD